MLPNDMRYSIVIPVYNEEENLPILYERLREVTADMDGECEIVLVNDGSVDRSWQIIEDLHRKDQRVKGSRFRGTSGSRPQSVLV